MCESEFNTLVNAKTVTVAERDRGDAGEVFDPDPFRERAKDPWC